MKVQKTNRKKILFLRFLCLCMMVLVGGLTTACNQKVDTPVFDEEVAPAEEISILAIVSGLDEVNEHITLRSMDYETEKELYYTVGADVRDKYGDIMPMSDVELGSIVEVVYDANRDKLLSIYISDEEMVSVVREVSGAQIDYVKNTVRINGTTYPMSDHVAAFSDNVQIGINEICSEDQLTIWMYNNKIYTFYVELGHGYVKLTDYAGYIGGMVEIGYDVIVPVTENMLLTVREGTYTLRIAKDGDVGTKQVQVIKNQEVTLSLADLAIQPKQTGSVLFDVTPADAKVYIDGKRVNTEGAIELTYGKHTISIIADGFESYSATFKVNYAYKVKKYTLVAEGEESSTTSTTAQNDSDTSTTTESGTTTDDSTQSDGSTTEETTTQDSSVKDVSTTVGVKTSNKVILSAPMGVSVYFDGEYLGIAPISFTKVTGSHIITFSQTGYLSQSYTVNFTDDGEDVTLSYDDLVSISSLIE